MSFFNSTSGIFGSPPKEVVSMNSLARSPSSPFRTNLSQFQDVTVDDSVTLSSTMGFRSSRAPFGGRTVKEFEEEMNSLKKENFNLKLRIYFLEEKMGPNFTEDKGNVIKENIELKAEIAYLQKEVREKRDLLVQAVKAMEVEEDEHKKDSQSKEEQIVNLQQEMEDLRAQVQDIRFMGNNSESPKSVDSNRHYEYVPDFASFDLDHRRFMDEADLEKHQNQLANFIYDKTEDLKVQIDALHRECESKDQTIDGLNRELTSANERLIDFAQQVKQYEEKLAMLHLKNGTLLNKVQDEQKNREKLHAQLAAMNQKYSLAKLEFDQEREEMQREKKALERTNMMLDMRVATLDTEMRKQRELLKEQQAKLDVAVAEAKKNQNLAVSHERSEKQNASNTDDRLISVPRATTPDGDAQEEPLYVQIKSPEQRQRENAVPSREGRKKSSSTQVPPTPDGKSLITFEKFLTQNVGDNEAIRTEFAALKHDFTLQKQKIVKLKSEQLKACEIIKNMIDFRNKANDTIGELKKAKQELERELERVVSKQPQQQNVTKTPTLLQDKLSQMNITAAVETPPCEKSSMADDDEGRENNDPYCDLELIEQYKILATELEAKMEVLVKTLKVKDSQMQYVRTQYDEILKVLEEKENKIVDLEFELLSLNQQSGKLDRSSVMEKGDAGSEKHSSLYKHELDEKNKEIDRLNVDLKKCTCYLQEIVNKELWDKNREIEKMHQKQGSSPEMAKLKKELSGKDLQLKLLKEKICELGLDIQLPTDNTSTSDVINMSSTQKNLHHIKALQDQLKSVKGERDFLEERLNELKASQVTQDKWQSNVERLRHELERSEKLRHETNEVCSVLSVRLEELAIYLDSLLKQKSVLGFLGYAKNKRLREIISNSLDMSRSFSMSLMSNPDESLAQLTNITALLNGSIFQELSLAEEQQSLKEEETHLSIIPDHISLTYESHLHKKVTSGNQPDSEQVIAALREQVFNLKSELQVRDNELNRLQQQHCEKESGVERLTDSEPEQRKNDAILLLTPKSTSATLKAHNSEGHNSESEAWSEPDRAVSRARIGLNRSIPPAARLHHCESTEDDDWIYHSMTPGKRRSALMELNQEIYRLQRELDQKSEEIVTNSVMYRQKLQELDREIQESKEKLEQAVLEKNSALKKLESLQKFADELAAFKKHYEDNMIGKDKELQDTINQLEVEKQKILMESQTYAQQARDAQNQVVAAQDKVALLEENMSKMEQNLRKNYEENLLDKLKSAEEVFSRKVRVVEEKCDAEIKIAQENLRLVKEEYARDFVKKTELETKLAETEKITSELADLKKSLHSYKTTISSYKEKEATITLTIQQYELQLATLTKDLAEANARCSQTQSDYTKVVEEKRLLEQEVGKVSEKERELRDQLKEIQSNLAQVSEKYGEQVTTLQKQKNDLELKVSELESCNADLHNRLIKAQTSRFSLGLNATLPADRQAYKRQYSDQNTYSSEDNADDRFRRGLLPSVADVERAEANSSPDLGIDSDHGRFSSLETNGNNVLPRPLLQTIELTESMNNLLDATNHETVLNSSVNAKHCCQKFVEVAQENNELKRKLLRMKRALEETATQLNLANQRKKQVEKTICKQIHKTSQVLRKAKANLDSGSESDVFRT